MSPTALERLALYFAAVRTRQGVLARAALGTPAAGDEALARELVDAMCAEIRPDGTHLGGAVPTIWRAHELLDLGRDAAIPRSRLMLALAAGAPGKPGRLRRRMRQGPPRAARLRALRPAASSRRRRRGALRAGHASRTARSFRAEPAARFAISCLALRAALRGRPRGPTPGDRQHLESLRLAAPSSGRLERILRAGRDRRGPARAGLGAAGPPASIASQLVGAVAAHQARRRTLAATPTSFATLEALHATGLRGSTRRGPPGACPRSPAASGPTAASASTAQQERALIALRALHLGRPKPETVSPA